jgi:hypothetical protein
VSEDFDIDELRKDFPDLMHKIEESIRAGLLTEGKLDKLVDIEKLKDGYEERFVREVAEAKTEARRLVKEELARDSSLGRARKVLADIAEMLVPYSTNHDQIAFRDLIAVKEGEVERAVSDLHETAALAKIAGYQLAVERKVRKHPMADTIVSVMATGGWNRFKSLDDVEEMLDGVISDLQEHVPDEEPKENEEARELKAHNIKLESELSLARRKLKKMEKMQEDRDETEERELEEYKHSKIAGCTNRGEMADLLENVDSVDEVDRIVRVSGRTKVSDPELERVRRKLGRGLHSDRDRVILNEGETPRRSNKQQSTILGFDTDDLVKLV